MRKNTARTLAPGVFPTTISRANMPIAGRVASIGRFQRKVAISPSVVTSHRPTTIPMTYPALTGTGAKSTLAFSSARCTASTTS
jgi:hypothetical protein